MLNENNRPSDSVRISDILANPDIILEIGNPSEKMKIAAVQVKPALIAHLPSAEEKVQLSAVIACPESILLVDAPTPVACFMAVERMLGADLLPGEDVLAAAKNLVLQMKKDKADGKSSGSAIERFIAEVKPFKN